MSTPMYPKKLQRTYTSEVGDFVRSSSASSKVKSEAKQMEVSKHRRIHLLRDNIDTNSDKNLIWEDF